MAYVPEPNAATALTIALGFVNLPAMGGSPFGPISGTGCNLIGTAFTMNITGSSGTWNSGTTYASGEQVNYGGNLYQSLQDGNLGNIPNPLGGYWTQLFTLTAEDVGCVIMVMGAGAGTPGQAAPLWTTIAAVTGYNTATLTDAAINDVALAQAIVYRPLTQTFQFYNGAYVLRDSIHSESSLTTNANFSFRVHSPNGAFVPQPGQPVLAYVQEGTYVGQWSPSTTYSINQTVSVYGQQFISLASGNHNNPPAPGTSTSYWATLDIFGGKIQQAKPKNLGALSNVVQTDCECVSWQVLLTEGVLALRSTGNPTHIDSFQGNGSTTAFNLTFVPVSMVSVVERSQGTVTMSGVNATAIGSGADFAELVVGNQITIDGIPLTVASLIDLTHITVYPNPGLPTGFGYTWLGPSNTAGIVTTQTVGGVHIVTWSSGDNFEGIAIGDSIYIHGSGPFTVATKPDAYTEITVSTDPGTWTPPGVGWQGPPVTVGLEGGALTTDYYWNPATNIVTQNPNSTPLPGTRTIYVTYTYVGVSNFYSQTLGAIAQALAAFLQPDGLTLYTVAGPTITAIEFLSSDTFDAAFSALCQYVNDGVTNYWYYPDARRGIHIEVQAITKIAPWNVNVSDLSDTNVLLQVANARTTEKMANAALVTTSNVLGTTLITQTLTIPVSSLGSGQRTFTVTWPVGQLVSFTWAMGVGLSGTPPNVSVVYGPTQNFTFTLLNSGVVANIYWSSNSTTLTLDVSIPALGGSYGGYVVVQYYPIISTVQTYFNTPAIVARQAIEGGSGEYDVSQKPSASAPILESEDVSQVIAEYFSQLSESCEIQTYRYGLVSGQGITINLPGIAGPGTFVVDQVSMVDQDNLLRWTVTCIRGAAIGDWKTAFKILTGAEGLSIIGGGTQGATLPPTWQPGFEIPISGDAMFSTPGFGVVQSYQTDGQGNPLIGVSIYGNPPSPQFDVVVEIWQELVSGPCAQEAAAISTNVIYLGGSLTVNMFQGRYISKLANPYGNTAQIPIADFVILYNDAVGNFTVTPDPLAAGCEVGDLFTIRTGGSGAGSPGIANPLTATATSYTDPLFFNPYQPTGLTNPNGNAGNIALVIKGTGKGQPPVTVISNTGDTVTVSPWLAVPDETSVIVLLNSASQIPPTTIAANQQSASGFLSNIPTENYANAVIRVECYLQNSDLTLGAQATVAFREMYLWGAQNSRPITTSQTMILFDGVINADATAGPVTYTSLPLSALINRSFTISKMDATSNPVTIQLAGGSPADRFDDETTSVVLASRGNSFTWKVHNPTQAGMWRATKIAGVPTPAPGGSGGIITQYVVVAGSSPTVTPSSAPTDNTMLAVIVQQDSTGYPINWNSQFGGISSSTVPVTPYSKSILFFAGSTTYGLWYLLPSTLGRNM